MENHSWYRVSEPKSNGSITKVPLCNSNDLKLRFLCPEDLDEVRKLCTDWFPIEYPESWYLDITSNPRFYSLAAIYRHKIVGLIVSEVKPYIKLSKEEASILSSQLNSSVIAYILSLGVRAEHRREGVASLLLENLLTHLTTSEWTHCKAVYLHVLSTNAAAIRFYESRSFRLHSFLPYYYSIGGKCKDGFSYVLYLNGGHPPWGLLDWLRWITSPQLCSHVVRGIGNILRRILPGITRLTHTAGTVT